MDPLLVIEHEAWDRETSVRDLIAEHWHLPEHMRQLVGLVGSDWIGAAKLSLLGKLWELWECEHHQRLLNGLLYVLNLNQWGLVVAFVASIILNCIFNEIPRHEFAAYLFFILMSFFRLFSQPFRNFTHRHMVPAFSASTIRVCIYKAIVSCHELDVSLTAAPYHQLDLFLNSMVSRNYEVMVLFALTSYISIVNALTQHWPSQNREACVADLWYLVVEVSVCVCV